MSQEMVPFNGLPSVPDSFELDGHTFTLMGDRIVRDGKEVAVLVSPGFGAGFSTWTDISPTNPFAVVAVLFDRRDAIANASDEEKANLLGDPEAYMGGVSDLVVTYVPIGTLFRVTEYDGSEGLETLPDAGFKEA